MKTSALKIGLILLLLIATGSFMTLPLMGADKEGSTPAPDNWWFSIVPGPTVDLNSSTQFIMINDLSYAITMDNGQILIFAPDGDSNWSEIQRLSVPDTSFTTFKVKDINHDNVPEIIAGTVEPGFMRIYRINDGKWLTNSNEKYVWSSITNIVIGNFDDPQMNNVLVQNQRGMLYLLKITGNDNALDLVWQSPSVWRAADSFLNLDFDQDGRDEIMVSYKAGGIGILKAINKQIVSIWDNYLWGKILAMSAGDWDDDGKPELFLSTSQKIIYILGYNNKTYQFEGQLSQLNYTTEKLCFVKRDASKLIFAADTAGKLHLLEYHPKSQDWLEPFVYPTGRIAQILGPDPNEKATLMLWGMNRKLLNVNTVKTKELILNYQGGDYTLSPSAWYQNNQLYLAPKALANIPGFGLTYSVDARARETSFRVERNGTKIAFKKENDKPPVLVEGQGTLSNEDCLLVNRDLYISVNGLIMLFKVNIGWDPITKTIQLLEPQEEAPQTEEAPQNEEPLEEKPEEITLPQTTGIGPTSATAPIVTPTVIPVTPAPVTLSPTPTLVPIGVSHKK